ncbi:hypothetical protein [Bdellovibrio sp. HCB337]|uniref:hypothetical protein n=1 Tax=Bdellovibrio sp. HCB337 TaxID=3394358 RepID=UPI0039A53F92
MNQQTPNTISLEKQIKEIIDLYRSMILDAVEQELGDSPNWKFLRGRLLKALGDRGLEGRIIEAIRTNFLSPK